MVITDTAALAAAEDDDDEDDGLWPSYEWDGRRRSVPEHPQFELPRCVLSLLFGISPYSHHFGHDGILPSSWNRDLICFHVLLL